MPWTKPYHPSRNRRLDPALYTSSGHVCFFTLRSYQHTSPFLQSSLATLVLNTLREEQTRQMCRVFAYCLMPDHLHFLVSPEHNGLSVLSFVNQYKGKTTNASWQVGWRGKLWQPRSYDHIVREEEDLRVIAQYILDNPVRAGLAERVEEWLWCGQMNPLPL